MSNAKVFPHEEFFSRLWVNEAARVFYDRLIDDGDRTWFKNLACELLQRNFKWNPDKEELFTNLRFGDLLRLDSPTPYYEFI